MFRCSCTAPKHFSHFFLFSLHFATFTLIAAINFFVVCHFLVFCFFFLSFTRNFFVHNTNAFKLPAEVFVVLHVPSNIWYTSAYYGLCEFCSTFQCKLRSQCENDKKRINFHFSTHFLSVDSILIRKWRKNMVHGLRMIYVGKLWMLHAAHIILTKNQEIDNLHSECESISVV